MDKQIKKGWKKQTFMSKKIISACANPSPFRFSHYRDSSFLNQYFNIN